MDIGKITHYKMKIEKKNEYSDHITYSSFWWIPMWIYLINKLEGGIKFEFFIILYLFVSFVVWFRYFYSVKLKKKENG
jgi:hypothetical protein